MRPKKIGGQIAFGLLVVTCLSFWVLPKLYYAVIDSGKNHYRLATTDLEPKKVDMTGVMLTIKVDNPQKETILLTSSELGLLGGDNISTFYKATHPELAGRVEIVDEGIKLRLKASDKPVTLKLPIALPYSIKTTFTVRRGKRSISKNKVTFTEKKPDILEESPAILKEEPDITPPSGLGQVAPASHQKVPATPSLNGLSFKNPLTQPAPRLLGSGGTGKDPDYKDYIVEVSNEEELLDIPGYLGSGSIFYGNLIIKFTADITVNKRQHGVFDSIIRLVGYEATNTIDGQGHTLTIGSNVRNMPVFKTDKYPSQRPPKATTIKNLTINYEEIPPENESVLLYIDAKQSNKHLILLQDIRGLGSQQGRLVYAPHATTILSGEVTWYSDDSEVSNDISLGMVYSSEISVRKTDDGRSPNINLASTWDTFKSTRGVYISDDGKYDAIVSVRAGRVSLTSTKGSAIYMNSPSSTIGARFEVQDGSQLACRTKEGAAAIAIFGSNHLKTSQSIIRSGANVVAISDEGRAAFLHEVKQSGTLRVTGSGTRLWVKAGDDTFGTVGALHFSVVGNQKLRVEDKAEVMVEKEKGRSAAIRFSGSGNDILVSGGGVLTVRNRGWTGGSPEQQKNNKLSDGGDAYGGQGILFLDGPSKETWIRAQGAGSRIDVRSEIGPALETRAKTELTLSSYASGDFVGRTASPEVGAVVIRYSIGKINLSKAKRFKFRNNHAQTSVTDKTDKTVGGKWISGPKVSPKWDIPLEAQGTSLQAWKRDPKVSLDGEPSKRWRLMHFSLDNKNWDRVASSSNPNFIQATYGKSSDYAQITGEGFQAEVEKLRQPTNADKRIYGRVEIPLTFPVAGGKKMRNADTDEVWVTIKLYRLKYKPGISQVQYLPHGSLSYLDFEATYDVVTYEKEVPTIGHKGTTTGKNKDLDGVRQFGEPKTYGVFEWDLSQDETIKKDKGDPFLWAGEYVEVIKVRRGGKKPNEKIDIISTPALLNQGRYVFNVRPIEVSSYELVDPILDKLAAKPQVSDATKEIELKVTTKKMRRHAAFIPSNVIEEGADVERIEKIRKTPTGWVKFPALWAGYFNYVPMITTGQETTVDALGDNSAGSGVGSVVLLKDKQVAFIRPRTYLEADQTTANQPSELFVMSAWHEDISALEKDLPPTYQEVNSLTSRETEKPFDWPLLDFKTTITGLKMPTKRTTYHDAVFDASPKLNLTPVVPKALAIDLTKKGKGPIEQVDITGSPVVTYQMKLMSPNPLATPTEMLMGYQVTFTVIGQSEILDTSDLILPAGVTETHTAKSIAFTSNRRSTLGEVVRIPLAVTGDFEIEMTGGGRTPQEKVLSMPRGIWDVKGEKHNFSDVDEVYWFNKPLPPADDAYFQEYYHLLRAPDRKVSVKVTKDSVKTPVYLSIRDSKLTVYYKQLKQGSDIKVTVDGKALTSFKVDNSDVEQSKPLNFKINGTRNIVAVTYTLADGTIKIVTWRNPKISN